VDELGRTLRAKGRAARHHEPVRRRYDPDQVMALILFLLCVVLVLVLVY
jgi:hypothetical protein